MKAISKKIKMSIPNLLKQSGASESATVSVLFLV